MADTRKIESHDVRSEYLGEERTLKVYVPNQQSKQPLPILYCHDGLEFFTHGRIATIAHEMMENGEIQPFYIAGIAVNLSSRREDYALDGKRHSEYQKFVIEETLPFLDNHYDIDSSSRLMAGISLGAVATLSFALSYPELFERLVLFSGAYFPPFQERLQEETDLSRLSTYMFVGDEETRAKTPSGVFDFYSYNLKMKAILEERGGHVEFQEGEGNHVWGTWQKQLPNALRWIDRQLKPS